MTFNDGGYLETAFVESVYRQYLSIAMYKHRRSIREFGPELYCELYGGSGVKGMIQNELQIPAGNVTGCSNVGKTNQRRNVNNNRETQVVTSKSAAFAHQSVLFTGEFILEVIVSKRPRAD
jgi:hypothetical protein